MFNIVVDPYNFPEETGKFMMRCFWKHDAKMLEDVEDLKKTLPFKGFAKATLNGYKKIIQEQTVFMYSNIEKTDIIEYHFPNGNIIVSDDWVNWECFVSEEDYDRGSGY